MSPVDQKPAVDWDAEAAQQKLIADEVEVSADKAPQPAPATYPTVKLRSKDVDKYPVTVSVVGSKPLVFESEGSTVEVPAPVAEQLAYSPVVEVAE